MYKEAMDIKTKTRLRQAETGQKVLISGIKIGSNKWTIRSDKDCLCKNHRSIG